MTVQPKGKQKHEWIQSLIPCICDREIYPHYMSSGCAEHLRKKLKEWDKKYA